MKLGHVAVFTDDMEKSVEFYKALGGKVGMCDTLDIGMGKNKKLTHMVFDGEATVELVEPSDKSMCLKNTGICEHFCFDVEDVDKTVATLKGKGINTFQTSEPMVPDIFGGIKIIFLTGPSGELIELFQKL